MLNETTNAAASEPTISTQPLRKMPADWVKEGGTYDCTTLIGPLFATPPDRHVEWPMFSYERPAYVLWNAIARELNKRGWSDEEIKTWLQSKSPRWAMDSDLGDAIELLGKFYAGRCEKIVEGN